MKGVRDYLEILVESALGLQMCTKIVIHCLGIFWTLSLTSVCVSDALPTVTLQPSGPVYVNDGGSFSVTCEIDKFKSSNFLYFYKNDAIWTFIYDRISCGHTDIVSGAVMCNASTSFTMVLNLVSIVDHHSNWTCRINGEGCSTQQPVPASCTSARATLLIIVPVTTVNLTNNSSQTLTSGIDIVRNTSIGITCKTAPRGSRPRATFQWYKRQGSQSIQILDQSISSTPDPIPVPGQPASDLIISYSTLILTGEMSYQNIYIFCRARDETNTGNFVQSEEVQLNIVYPPVVQISPNNTLYNVIVGTQNFIFTCNIIEAKPLPQANNYSWIHKSLVIPGQTESSYTLQTVKKSDHGEFRCTARNEYGSGTSNSLDLNVQYSPAVNPFTSPVKVIQGNAMEIVCSADGNPSPQLIWNPAGEDNMNRSRLYYAAISRDKAVNHTCTATNIMIPTAGSQQSGSDSKQLLIDVLYFPAVNPFTSPVKVIQGKAMEIVCTADGNPSPQLIWNPAGEDNMNRSRLYYAAISRDKAVNHTCTATNTMVPTTGSQQSGSDSKQLLIDVLYSPAVNPFTSPVKVIQGKAMEIVCAADGNPSPQLIWNPAGEDNMNRSRLYYAAISRDKAVNHTCTATNTMVPTTGSQQSGSDSKQLLIDVLYSPAVNPFTSPVKMIQGKAMEIVCSADGNPSPQLIWNPAGEDNMNRSRLYYTAISRDKAVNHTCTATNTMIPTTGSQQSGSDSKQLLIDVLYSPSVNPFTSPVKVIQGKAMEIVCSADGNPSPQLIWNPAGEDNMNRSRLYYAAISRDKAVNHTCTATNTMVPTTGSQQSGSDSKQLLIDVLYSPIVKPFIFPNEVIEGQSFMVVCSADGNPSPQLIWNPAGEDNVNRSRLYYAAISRDKAVVHTCTATNNMVPTTGSQQTGSDSKELFINVLYNASIFRFNSKSNSSVLAEGNLLEIECQVDSNPYSFISLYLENDLKLEFDKALNLSYNKSATCLDAGKYTCNATNRIMNGIAVSKELQITVTCQPRLDYRRNISTERYGALGDNVTLEVYVIAYPKPENITWYHRQDEADIWQIFPYQPPSSSGLYSSLIVHLASESDFGYYMVNMSNSFGSYSETYQINAESRPGVPTNFTVTVSGPDSVKLEWTPGFGGGHLQYFIIQYRILPDGTWVQLDQIKDSGSMRQAVTITGLQQKTTYEFSLYAENKKGPSDKTSAIMKTTEFQTAPFPVGPVAGSISGALVAGVCVIFVILFLRRHMQMSKREDDFLSTELKEKEKPESGLKDNPVYDSSDHMPSPSSSSGAEREYAVVSKKKVVMIENTSNVYAQVHKNQEKKINGAADRKRGKVSRGGIYENADITGRSPSRENVYANSDDVRTEGSCDNVYEETGASTSYGPMANKDGLLYADLMLDPPTTKHGKPFIRGIENRTEYAEIAYGKRGVPLSDGDEEKKKE